MGEEEILSDSQDVAVIASNIEKAGRNFYSALSFPPVSLVLFKYILVQCGQTSNASVFNRVH